tara:strand:+ start:3071 stop:4444 length:1374 start_codon:yes stop_codon:yes gene_type:complete
MSDAQSQYFLERVDFTTERFPDETFDLSTSVVELNIFESVELPYLTASLAMMDDVAFKTTIGIKGSERVTLQLKATKNSNSIIKKFMVTGIAKEVSVNERTDVRVLTLLEEHAYLSAIQKISESHVGVPEDIIEDILNSHLDKKIMYGSDSVPKLASQSKMKVIIPQWNPLEAVDWLRDRMAVTNGSPFFLFSTLRDDDIHLNDLSTLMETVAWNKETPYTYAQTSHNTFAGSEGATQSAARTSFHVKSFSATSIESTMRLAQAGALGSEFNVLDLTSGSETQDGFHSGRDTLNVFLEDIGFLPEDGISFDDSLSIGTPNKGEFGVSNYKSKSFSSVVASQQFYDNDGKTPLAGYHDENANFGLYKLKIKSAALRSLLMNNVFTISVPGQPYLLENRAGVGSIIKLNYAEPTLDASRMSEVDKNRSGNFLVYRTRHKFVDGLYDAHLDIVKLVGSTS